MLFKNALQYLIECLLNKHLYKVLFILYKHFIKCATNAVLQHLWVLKFKLIIALAVLKTVKLYEKTNMHIFSFELLIIGLFSGLISTI